MPYHTVSPGLTSPSPDQTEELSATEAIALIAIWRARTLLHGDDHYVVVEEWPEEVPPYLRPVFDRAIKNHGREIWEAFSKCLHWHAKVRVNELLQLPYPAYLETPHWQNCREQALEAAQHRCAICNAANSLEVHHRTYERRGQESPGDLTVLCGDCHKLFHDNGRLAK